jgi:hypothetical protein
VKALSIAGSEKMPGIAVESKRRKLETLQRQHPGAVIIDVTSNGVLPWVKFSPFYPHGNIPVPFSTGVFAASVEGIWQGLKVFVRAGVDSGKFNITTMQGIKRSVRANGPIQGHRAGVSGQRIMSYREARYVIYLPSYKWVLDHALQAEIAALKQLISAQPVILLDYETNVDVDNLNSPLSHASLIRKYVTNSWPEWSG